MDVRVPINAPGQPIKTFRNADGSGWMELEQWEYWRSQWGKDHTSPRLQPSYKAYAAALISGVTPEKADEIKYEVFMESEAYWRSQHGFGRVVYQFMKTLPSHHAAGTIALMFVPYIGPLLSTIAQGMTPMVNAASKESVAKYEAGRVSSRFRENYYSAMDSYLKGEGELPPEYLEYHAKVIAPAALEVQAQIKAGTVKTQTGVYELDVNGLDLWASSGETGELEVYGGIFDRTTQYVYQFQNDLSRQPGTVLVSAILGAVVGVAAGFALQEA